MSRGPELEADQTSASSSIASLAAPSQHFGKGSPPIAATTPSAGGPSLIASMSEATAFSHTSCVTLALMPPSAMISTQRPARVLVVEMQDFQAG